MPLTEVCCCCSLITKLCPILWDPMDCSPPDSSVHEISQQEYWSALIFLLQGILSTQGSNLLSLHWQADSLVLSHLVYQLSSVQSLSHARLFVTPRTVAQQASLSITDPGACSNSCSSSQWCHPTISSSVVPFSPCSLHQVAKVLELQLQHQSFR